MKSFIHSLSKLVWIKRGFFIRTSFDRLWMEIFPFLFLILKGFYKGFQMRYHLFFNSNGKAVKTIKMFFWKSAMWYIMSMSVGVNLRKLTRHPARHPAVGRKCEGLDWFKNIFHGQIAGWFTNQNKTSQHKSSCQNKVTVTIITKVQTLRVSN